MDSYDIEDAIVTFFDNNEKIPKKTNLDRDVCDAILCSKFHEYRREQCTEFTYSSMYLENNTNIDFIIDICTDDVYKIDKVYKILGNNLFKHPITNTWLYIPSYAISNECSSCDGTTHSSISICEENQLLDIIIFHFTTRMREEIFGIDDVDKWVEEHVSDDV